eukprot:4417188-Pleurochrysis_carterae.AAC.1
MATMMVMKVIVMMMAAALPACRRNQHQRQLSVAACPRSAPDDLSAGNAHGAGCCLCAPRLAGGRACARVRA